jgi:hypothetical protein
MADTTAPNLVSLTFPSVIDLSNGEVDMVLTAGATDDLSGVSAVYVVFDRVIQSYFFGARGESNTLTIDNLVDSFSDGSSSLTQRIRTTSATGVFNVTSVFVIDNAGNRHDYAPGVIGPTSLTIVNNNPPPTIALETLGAAAPEAVAAGLGFDYVVTRTGNLSRSSTVNYLVLGSGPNAASAADFKGGALPSGTLTFAAGEDHKTIHIDIADDGLIEADETFSVFLDIPFDAYRGNYLASGLIGNDDVAVKPVLQLLTSSAQGTEAAAASSGLNFMVTRTGDPSGGSSVSWSVAGSGANPIDAADFGGVLPSGLLVFSAGETSKFITVTGLVNDAKFEADETFTLTLSNPNGATVSGTTTATGVVLNDDASPSLALSPANVTHAEGNAGSTPFAFTVTRTGDTSGATTVNWAVTGSGPNAANAADFGGVLPTGVVSFGAGETTKVVTVNVAGDTAVEQNEQFTVTLSGASGGALISTAAATGTITNDDTAANAPPAFTSAANINAPENRVLATTLTATDPNGDAVKFAITGGDDAPAFTLNAATGALSWVATPDFETKEGFNGNGVYYLTVSATDSHGASTSQALTITVTDVNEPGRLYTGAANGHDTVTGGFGNDTLYLGNGGATASGGDGNDVIHGGNGGDLLIGGRGADTLTGGGGADHFRMLSPYANGADAITDFDTNGDVIELLKGDWYWAPATPAGAAHLVASDLVTRGSIGGITAADGNKVVVLQQGATAQQLASAVGGAANAYVVVSDVSTGHVEIWYDANWSDVWDRVRLVGLNNVHSVAGFSANDFSVYS